MPRTFFPLDKVVNLVELPRTVKNPSVHPHANILDSQTFANSKKHLLMSAPACYRTVEFPVPLQQAQDLKEATKH